MSNELNWIQNLPTGWESMPLKAIANYSDPLGCTQKFAVITGYPFFWGHTIKKK
jgi:hypothetical protein